MSAMASQITCLKSVYLTVYSGTDQRKYQSSVSLAFVQGIHRWPVNSPHKWPVTQKMFQFDDVIMIMSRDGPTPRVAFSSLTWYWLRNKNRCVQFIMEIFSKEMYRIGWYNIYRDLGYGH